MNLHGNSFRWPRSSPALLCVIMVLFGASCQTTSGTRSQALAQRDATIRELEARNDDQSLGLLEKEALITQLEQRLNYQQQSLDDAIHEVIRAKARQRSIESRAETAAEMAEAEIALKSLRDKANGRNRLQLTKAEQLLTMASAEFERQNFGGALYLVNQSKSLIKTSTLSLAKRGEFEGLEGEIPFAAPLQLLVNKKSNLRKGPGRKFKVLVSLEKGTAITAYSIKNPWLKIEGDAGWSGWIHRSLVSPR